MSTLSPGREMPDLNSMQLKQKLVVVSGASSGLGEATSKAMARRGAHVVLLGRDHSDLARVAGEIRRFGAGVASVYPVDLSDRMSVARVASLVEAELGCAEVLVNCAGDASTETSQQASAYTATLHCTRAFLPNMIACGEGHLVNVTSADDIRFALGHHASPLTVHGFNEALRMELTSVGIDVSYVYADAERAMDSIGARDKTARNEDLAKAIVHAVEHGRRDVALPVTLRYSMLLQRISRSLSGFQRTRTARRPLALRAQSLQNGAVRG